MKFFKLCFVLFFDAWLITACEQPQQIENQPDAFFSRWMESISDEVRLRDIVIPGSHDAGSVGMSPLALTQNSTVRTQLAYGVRYFDLRVQKKGDELIIFHGPISGQPLKNVLASVKTFLDNSPSETLILDFQHFKGGAESATFDALSAALNPNIYAVSVAKDEDPTTFIDSLRLKNCRGKIIVFWSHAYQTPAADFIFFRNNDGGTLNDCALESYYSGSLHRKSSEKFIEEALPDYFNRFEKKNKGLFVLQCQLTGQTLLTTPISREAEHDIGITAYIDAIAGDSRRLALTNIIMRDFITDDIRKVKSILRLNAKKSGLIEESKLAEFTQKTAK